MRLNEHYRREPVQHLEFAAEVRSDGKATLFLARYPDGKPELVVPLVHKALRASSTPWPHVLSYAATAGQWVYIVQVAKVAPGDLEPVASLWPRGELVCAFELRPDVEEMERAR